MRVHIYTFFYVGCVILWFPFAVLVILAPTYYLFTLMFPDQLDDNHVSLDSAAWAYGAQELDLD